MSPFVLPAEECAVCQCSAGENAELWNIQHCWIFLETFRSRNVGSAGASHVREA